MARADPTTFPCYLPHFFELHYPSLADSRINLNQFGLIDIHFSYFDSLAQLVFHSAASGLLFRYITGCYVPISVDSRLVVAVESVDSCNLSSLPQPPSVSSSVTFHEWQDPVDLLADLSSESTWYIPGTPRTPILSCVSDASLCDSESVYTQHTLASEFRQCGQTCDSNASTVPPDYERLFDVDVETADFQNPEVIIIDSGSE